VHSGSQSPVWSACWINFRENSAMEFNAERERLWFSANVSDNCTRTIAAAPGLHGSQAGRRRSERSRVTRGTRVLHTSFPSASCMPPPPPPRSTHSNYNQSWYQAIGITTLSC
jgi:hypothetical protein